MKLEPQPLEQMPSPKAWRPASDVGKDGVRASFADVLNGQIQDQPVDQAPEAGSRDVSLKEQAEEAQKNADGEQAQGQPNQAPQALGWMSHLSAPGGAAGTQTLVPDPQGGSGDGQVCALATDASVPFEAGGLWQVEAQAVQGGDGAVADAQNKGQPVAEWLKSKGAELEKAMDKLAHNHDLVDAQTRVLEAQLSEHQAILPAVSEGLPSAQQRSYKVRQLMDISGAVSNTEVSQLRMTPQAVLAPSEVVVAEQIRHWVVRDVQNAQLRLDGLGESPVHIDISVKGQVATVLFATDSLQARALIQDSLKHLDALLGQEGLVLSGSSGSTSSQQGRSQGGQADPAIEAVLGARRLQVRSQVSIESVVSPTRPGLDVYV